VTSVNREKLLVTNPEHAIAPRFAQGNHASIGNVW
jgi:hypothetical protein